MVVISIVFLVIIEFNKRVIDLLQNVSSPHLIVQTKKDFLLLVKLLLLLCLQILKLHC